jgi:paraquat-inducible protein B
VTDNTDKLADIPSAVVSKETRRLSVIWLIPIVALIVGLVFVYKDYQGRGPVISITFESAEGIEPNKTWLKYRDVSVGQVKNVKFTKDLSQVKVKVQLTNDIASQISENTRFWAVRPRITLTGASGISTLFSGVYITMDPGAHGKKVDKFTGLEEPPLLFSHSVGTSYKLRTPELGSLSIGAPVYYRQIQVGEVLRYKFSDDQTLVEVDIFVKAPHDQLVKQNSRFWNASGVGVELGGDGVKVDMASLVSLAVGGVAFETPDSLINNQTAQAGAMFTLYKDRTESIEKPLSITVPYVLYFDDSVRGLSPGAAVEFRGIRIGMVTEISVQHDPANGSIHIPVLVQLEPERILMSSRQEQIYQDDYEHHVAQMMDQLVANGMRARLQTGNLLTGQLIVEFDMMPDAQAARIEHQGEYPVLPTVPGTLTSLTQTLTAIMNKLDSLPLADIGQHLEQTLAGVDALINGPEMQQTLADFAATMQSTRELMQSLDKGAPPLLVSLKQLSDEGGQVIRQADKTLQELEGMVAEDGVVGSELTRMLQEISAAAKSMGSLTEYLERHPEALLQGK